MIDFPYMASCEVETPAKTWPNSFGRIPLFVHFPYLLPTLIASAILLVGAFLSLFLAWDGGPQHGSIHLPVEKDVDEERGAQALAPNTIDLGGSPIREERPPSFGELVMKGKISGYFARRVREAYDQNTVETPAPTSPPPPPTGPSLVPRNRVPSRGARLSGSAYGYRPRHGSQPTFAALRRGSIISASAPRRRSSVRPAEDVLAAPEEELSLAQRLLIGS